MLKHILTYIFSLFPVFFAQSQDIFHEKIISFEGTSLPGWSTEKHSSFGIDKTICKHGKQSLRWNWTAGDKLMLYKEIGFQKADTTGKDTYLSTFVVWVYNEKPSDDYITFCFGKNGKVDCSFDFRINFKGWRAAWVCFERDMQGTPQTGMNQMTIIAPTKAGNGTLYFDHIILSVMADSRYQTPDFQAPFVNKETDSHWLALLKYSKMKPDYSYGLKITSETGNDIQLIEKRLKESIYKKSTKVSNTYLSELQSAVNDYHIKTVNGKITGKPLWYIRSTEVYERFTDNWYQRYAQTNQSLDNCFELMLKIACAYQQTNNPSYKEQLKEMFMKLYQHTQEQGIAEGSGLGTIHHSGYSFREYYPALFLMKDVLLENGKLDEAVKSMQWYAATGEVFIKPEKPGMDMDAFNTTAPGRLASILMMNNSPEKITLLRDFVRWADNGLQPSDGLMGAFKIDGAVMHHCNNYPAYGIGGISGAALLTWLFSGTNFHFSESGHYNLKRAMQTMSFYCNTKEWPVSISGRHPRGTEKLIPEYYALMALAGTPDGKTDFDTEMAGTYLRLIQFDSKETDYRKEFLAKGMQPQKILQGNLTVNYGCLNIHRRDQWMAAAHGFSRYLWASEHYAGANYYGRYLSYGSLFIQTGEPDKLITNTTSGYQQKGWNWNAIPGATTIHLPLDLLKANILNVDTYSGYEEMLYSDEAFAGGISQQGSNGIFAMKLHEHDKYNGSLRARKSIFFFDKMIVCLGSDIENSVTKYPTRTTLYQTLLYSEKETTWQDGNACKTLNETTFTSTGNFLVNNIRTGYYIPKNQPVSLCRKMQHSCDQATDKPTQGLFASAWIEHGNAPSGAAYEYAVFPETSPEKMKMIAQQIQNKKNALYEVLRKDSKAHIVKDNSTNTTGYVLFEPDQFFENQLIEKVDSACLLMLKENGNELILTVCDPDLRLYTGASDDIYDENGKRIERSIYSRPWIGNKSIPSVIFVTLKGKWDVKENEFCKIKKLDDMQTIISFRCQDGLSREIIIRK